MAWHISLLVLVFSLWSSQVIAQSDTAVRSELTSLRNRVSRLEGEIRRLSGGSRPQTAPPVREGGEAIGASDPMFARLATLVIELKEDIRELQKRVSVLENRKQL
jgi:hypothetical protein